MSVSCDGALERRRLGDPCPQIVADGAKHEADQERNAPAPREEAFSAECGCQDGGRERSAHRADRCGSLLQAADKSAPSGWRMLHQERRRAAPFAAGGEALQHAADHQQHRSEQPDRGIGRNQSGRAGCHRHQSDRHHQRLAAAETIAVPANDHRADRPHQEADGEGGEARKQGGDRIGRGKERAANSDGKETVDDEVEDLEHLPDGTGEYRAPNRRCVFHCGCGRGLHVWFPR